MRQLGCAGDFMENCLNPLAHGGLDRSIDPRVLHPLLLGTFVWGEPEDDGIIAHSSAGKRPGTHRGQVVNW